ncbi:MAG: hypothetical protein ACTSY1_00600 [Alphaproteobacteria bacterium]
MIGSLLEKIGQRSALVLAGGVVFSLVVPELSHAVAPILPHVIVVILALAFIRIDLAQALAHWRRIDRLAVALGLLLVVIPIGVYFLARALGLSGELVLMLILVAAGPPLASGTNFAYLLGLDAELAVNLVVAGTLVVPFVAPPLVFGLLGLALEVDVLPVLARLAGVVAAAFVIAIGVRRIVGQRRLAASGALQDGIATLVLIVFLVAVMDGIAPMIVQTPGTAATLLAAAFAINFGLPLVVALMVALGVFLRGRRRKSPARAFATVVMFLGNRNLALFLTALPASLVTQVAPFVALYQIPIYLTPLVMGPVYRWLANLHPKGR